MAVFQPTYRDPKTGEQKHSNVWWYEFTFAGKRIRESAKTTRKTIAIEAEKNKHLDMERALAGMPIETPLKRIRSVSDVMKPYVESHHINHRSSSTAFTKSCASNITRLLGAVLLPDLSEDRIRTYITERLKEGVPGRTINAELGELSRGMGRTWRELWPRVRKLEENKDVGQALSAEQERRLMAAADANRSPNIRTMVRVSLLTGLRAGELSRLTWGRVDLGEGKMLTVGKAKTLAGTGRQIPMNNDLFQVFTAHAQWFTKRFGAMKPEHYVFPWGAPYPTDPTRPATELKTAWETIRTKAKVECRWHDLRHTVCTKMAEAGVPESTMLAIMGHMSRSMLERYSHIRMKAKREAVESLSFTPKTDTHSVGVPKESPKVKRKASIH
ncbi:MAG: site-specific integrase [Acidobacteria bacterium]|nr:site-specific integrase [Acidobacteriota bacterium]